MAKIPGVARVTASPVSIQWVDLYEVTGIQQIDWRRGTEYLTASRREFVHAVAVEGGAVELERIAAALRQPDAAQPAAIDLTWQASNWRNLMQQQLRWNGLELLLQGLAPIRGLREGVWDPRLGELLEDIAGVRRFWRAVADEPDDLRMVTAGTSVLGDGAWAQSNFTLEGTFDPASKAAVIAHAAALHRVVVTCRAVADHCLRVATRTDDPERADDFVRLAAACQQVIRAFTPAAIPVLPHPLQPQQRDPSRGRPNRRSRDR
ncbi:MAG: hypothetical protein NXI31_18260 [bacterium]|nr:hypothetical protein [bacterium]